MTALVEHGTALAASVVALPYSCRRAAAVLAFGEAPTSAQTIAALQALADEIHSMRARMGAALADKDRMTRLAVNRGYEVATNCAEHGQLLVEQRDQIADLSSRLDQIESERKDWVGLVHTIADRHADAKPLIENASKRIMAARSHRESKARAK